MALTTVVTTFDLADYFGTDFDARRVKAWATNNAPDETIHDESTGETRIGAAYATVATDGTGSFSHWAPGVDANPATWQTTYHFDVPDRTASRGRRTLTLGPFTVITSGELTALVEEQIATPTATASDYATAAGSSADDAALSATNAATSEANAQTAETNAELAQTLAEAARDDAVDISGISTSDAVVEALVKNTGGAGPLTSAALSATIAKNATPPLPAHAGATATEINGRPCEYLKGYWWGYGSGLTIYRSADGVTWTAYATVASGQLQRIIPVGSGNAAVIVTDMAIYKSADFFAPAGASPVFSAAKVTVNGGARHTRFGASSTPQGRTALDDGRKLIVAQYGPGAGTNFTDSRYAYASIDYGETWTAVWDSDTHTTNLPVDSHVHGAEYDPYEDRFYVIEGHSTDAGVWRSDAATLTPTWTLDTGYRMYSAPTCICATDDGLFLASDDQKAGTLGIPRVGAAADRAIIRTWAWRTGFGSDVIGFGTQATRDPETGLVYASYQSSFAGQSPIIAGGTATVGGLVWSWPQATAASSAADEINAIALGPNGVIKAPALIGGSRYIVTAPLTRRGQQNIEDTGGIRGGSAPSGTSLAAGAGASTGTYNFAAVVGVKATGAQQDATALGYNASVTATRGVAVGARAATPASDGTVVGVDASVAFGQSTAVGQGASTNTGGSATAVGCQAAVRSSGVGVGYQATVNATGGTALGQGATVTTAHNDSVALGRNTTTTAAQQVHVGPRHLGITESATEPTAPAADNVRFYALDNGSGQTVLRAKFNGGKTVDVAHQAGVHPFPAYTTAARPSPATAGEGAAIFDTDLNKPVWSDGTAWVDAIVLTDPPTIVKALRTTDSTPVNNSNLRTLDSVLQVTVGAGETWEFELPLYYSAATTADLTIQFQTPTGSTMTWIADAYPSTIGSAVSTGTVGRTVWDASSTPTIGGTGVGNKIAARLTGVLTVGGTGGTFGLKWAQATAEVSDAVVHAGSRLKATKWV